MALRSIYVAVFIIFGINNQLYASHDWYGKVFVDYQSTSNDINGNKTDVNNNASRFGIKGSFLLSDNSKLKLVYQAEYQFDPVDGKARGDDGTLKQRNTFIGIQTDLGMLFAGTHDSAFRKSQLKIDLFNDLAADIKTILRGENRMNNLLGFTTRTSKKGISVTFNAIKGSTESVNNSARDSTSVSLNYKTKSFYAAISIDSKLEGYDSTRLTLQLPWDKTQLGIIYQDTEKLSTGIKEDGYVVSLSYKVRKKGLIKVQQVE